MAPPLTDASTRNSRGRAAEPLVGPCFALPPRGVRSVSRRLARSSGSTHSHLSQTCTTTTPRLRLALTYPSVSSDSLGRGLFISSGLSQAGLATLLCDARSVCAALSLCAPSRVLTLPPIPPWRDSALPGGCGLSQGSGKSRPLRQFLPSQHYISLIARYPNGQRELSLTCLSFTLPPILEVVESTV